MAQAIINEKNKSQDEIESLEVAEASRESEWTQPSFVADLFMGDFRFASLNPFPTQSEEDRKVGDAFLEKLKDYLDRALDGDQVDRDRQIPDTVMKGLAELGCFGMKIPKQYGGLGLSQINYLRALALVAEYCGSTAGTLSAHQSIGVPQPLLLFGTEQQKQKYLPRFAKGAVSAFALTEPQVGSDPAKMSTTAELTAEGDYILNGQKLWCTNGAIAEIIVVMARTPSITVKGKERQQITAFIVETNSPGFKVVHRCQFMGLSGIQNALLEFKDVRVPKENIIWGTGKGLKLALITLNAGRLSLPACAVGGARKALTASREWANERTQWGAQIGKHEAGASKLAFISSHAYAMEASTLLAGAWVDNKSQDIRLEAAISKFFASLFGSDVVNETLQLRGGRGYEKAHSLHARGESPWPVERWYRDARINQIVEGTNEIMTLFIAREALDRHLKIAGDVLNPKLGMGVRLAALVKAGMFYALWYPRRWFHLGSLQYWGYGKLGRHLRYLHGTSRKLSRALFHLMAVNGPKLEKKQNQLRRVVEIAMELYTQSATIAYALSPEQKEKGGEVLADEFCRQSQRRVRNHFLDISNNTDDQTYKVGRQVMDGKFLWQEV